jgi:hypothetical protein
MQRVLVVPWSIAATKRGIDVIFAEGEEKDRAGEPALPLCIR